MVQDSKLLEESRCNPRYLIQRSSSHVTDISRQKGQGLPVAEAEVEAAVVGGAAASAPATIPHSQVIIIIMIWLCINMVMQIIE